MRRKKGKQNIKCTLKYSTIDRWLVITSNAQEGGMENRAIGEYCYVNCSTHEVCSVKRR